MGRSVVLGALLLLLVANVSFSQAPTAEKKYFKVGGTLRLSPQPVSGPITSIVWKYDKNLLAESVPNVDLTYYSKFKGRTTLNTTTGVLEIRDMTTADTSVYSVEINNQVQSQVYQAVEIEDVPIPEVILQPLACNRPSTCGLKCHGDITNAGPVTYSWKKDDGEWEGGRDKKDLTRLEMDSVKTFTCRMKNSVSEKESLPFKNPFYQVPPEPESESSPVGAIVGGVFVVVIAIVLFVLVFLYITKETFKTWVNVNIFRKKTEDKNKDANEEKNESQRLTNVNSDGSNTATEQ